MYRHFYLFAERNTWLLLRTFFTFIFAANSIYSYCSAISGKIRPFDDFYDRYVS